MRKETEAIRQRKEEERLAKEFGTPIPSVPNNAETGSAEDGGEAGEAGPSGTNGSVEVTAAT